MANDIKLFNQGVDSFYLGVDSVQKVYLGGDLVWPLISNFDPYYDNVTLLLSMEGVDGEYRFKDLSPLGVGITANPAIRVSNLTSKFRESSTSFPLAFRSCIATQPYSGVQFGTEDFTIETWVNITEAPANAYPIWAQGNPNSGVSLNIWVTTVTINNVSNSGVSVFFTNYSAISSSIPVGIGQWNHIAFTRQLGVCYLWINGQLAGSTEYAVSSVDSTIGIIGCNNAGSFDLGYRGSMNSYRVTKGVARYTSQFVPPVKAFSPNRPEIYGSRASVGVGKTVNLTFTFPDPPTGFTVGSVVVTGGTLTDFSVTGFPEVYEATYIPNFSSELGTIVIPGSSYLDLGGNPGTQSNTLTIPHDPQPPELEIVHYGSNDGSIIIGEEIKIAVIFSKPVVVRAGSLPSILLNTGGTAVYSEAKNYDMDQSYVGFGFSDWTDAFTGGFNGVGGYYKPSVPGTGLPCKMLVFSYTPAYPDIGVPNIGFASFGALQGVIEDEAGNPVVSSGFDGLVIDRGVTPFGYPGDPGAVVSVDTSNPSLTSIGISSVSGMQGGNVGIGDIVYVTAQFSEAVFVSGSPSVSLTIGTTNVQATYSSGSGTSALVFQYTILAGQSDSDGISIPANSVSSSTLIRDASGNTSVLIHSAVPSNPLYTVDTTQPTVQSLTFGSNDGVLSAGETVNITVVTNEVVNVVGTPIILLNNGGSATYSSGSGSDTLVFSYTALAGENTSSLTTASTGALSGDIINSQGNPIIPSGFDNKSPSITIEVDTVAPVVTSVVNPPSPQYVNSAGTLSVTLNFSKTIMFSNGGSVVVSALANRYDTGTDTFTLTSTGTPATESGVSQLIFSNSSLPQTLTDTDGLKIVANSLSVVSGYVRDAAGNNASTTFPQLIATNQWLDTYPPSPPVLSLGVGVSGGANLSEATQSSGVITLTAEANSSVVVTLTGAGVVTKTVTGNGPTQVPVVLTSGNVTTLGNGTISVSAVATDAVGNSSTLSTTSFIIDTTLPSISITTPISGDGLVDGDEDELSLTISGTSSGVDGRTVTVVVGGVSYTTAAASGGAWSITLTSTQIKALTVGAISVTADVSNSAGTSAPQATASFLYDPTMSGYFGSLTAQTFGWETHLFIDSSGS